MQKPYLFLDFDGLKFNTMPSLVAYMNERFEISSIASDYADNPPLDLIIKKYRKDYEITTDEAYAVYGEEYLRSIERHKDIMPIDGMCEVVKMLAQKHKLWTVTSRQESSIDTLGYLFDKYIPGCISGVHFVYRHLGNAKFSEVKKKDFIASLTGEKIAIVDDSPSEIVLTQDVIPSYLFDPIGYYDHRKDIQNRLRSWEEIGDKFL